MPKKSYMNKSNILGEGMFSNSLKGLILLAKRANKKFKKSMELSDKEIADKIKKSGIHKKLDKLNNGREQLEKDFEEAFGVKLKHKTHKLEDFLDI
jgi:AAA+ superfamily predicted ATPase